MINSRVVAQLDTVYVEGLLAESSRLCLTVRSCRPDRPPHTAPLLEQADVYIENMVCPPPPVQARLSDTVIDQLIVPAPNWGMSCHLQNTVVKLGYIYNAIVIRKVNCVSCMHDLFTVFVRTIVNIVLRFQ